MIMVIINLLYCIFENKIIALAQTEKLLPRPLNQVHY